MKTGAYDVLDEHQHIRTLVDRLQGCIDQQKDGTDDWLAEVRPLVGELANRIGPHFNGEEAEFFQDVRQRIPRHAATIDKLIQQHRRLLQDLVALAGRLENLKKASGPDAESWVMDLTRTLRLLSTHEEQENELMLVAYWQDLGEAD